MFATQDVRLTGFYEDMHPGGFHAYLKGKMMSTFQIWGDYPVENLKLKMPGSSCIALGPRALRDVAGISFCLRGAFGAHLEDGLVELRFSKAVQQHTG